MCGTCGCSDGAKATLHDGNGSHTHLLPDGRVVRHSHDHGDAQHAHDHGHDHSHNHDHSHGHSHSHGHGHDHSHPHGHSHKHEPQAGHEVTRLEAEVLGKNQQLAARNRGYFLGREWKVLNLVSSPGSGKTTLLERMLREVGGEVGVLEGDQETDNDARRLRSTGAPVIQINTGTGCHLEADMVWEGVAQLGLGLGATLFIENVGNLVCPALFDLGESARVLLFSVTEGEDKPLKYPHMFRSADLVLLTKVDLLPHLDFDVAAALAAVEQVAMPGTPVMQVSSRTGEGLAELYDWIRQRDRAAMAGLAQQ